MAVQKRGHIKIARKAFTDDKWWKKKRVFSQWEAWVDMIQLAQWEAKEFMSTKFGTIRLERGEFVLSQRKMAQRWGWGRQSVRSFTESPTFTSRLATQRETPAGTVYLIVNYDLYQSTDLQLTQPATQQITQDQPSTNPRTSSRSSKATTPAVAEYAFMGSMRPVWKAAYGGSIPSGSAKVLKKPVSELGEEEVARRLAVYCNATEGQYASIPHFANTIGTWAVAKRNGHPSQEEQHRKRGILA